MLAETVAVRVQSELGKPDKTETSRVARVWHDSESTDGETLLLARFQCPARCRAAGIPAQAQFATKPALARAMVARTLDAGIPQPG
jgi:hypothetical protein